jgi:hypothetical protein
VTVFTNFCGNGLVAGRKLAALPVVDSLSSIHVVDLFGNGTACLVWSTRLPGTAAAIESFSTSELIHPW